MGALYALQISVAKLRGVSPIISKIVDNQPVLLMRGQVTLDENLKATKVTVDDLRSKLREANVTDLSQIKAVVLETTGDISVLHSTDTSLELDDFLISDVIDWNTTK